MRYFRNVLNTSVCKIQNNGNSEHKHFGFNLAFDYILVTIRNDASCITVITSDSVSSIIPYDD